MPEREEARVTVAVIHPFTLMRDVLERMLAAHGLEIVGGAERYAQARSNSTRADVVLVDESALDDGDDFDGPPVVVLLPVADDATFLSARAAGVRGIAVGTGSPGALADTLRRVARATRSGTTP